MTTLAEAPTRPRQASGAARSGRPGLLAVGLLALAGAVAAWARAGLAWDGSYLLFETLHRQEPFILHGRYGTGLLLYPVVVASRLTEDLDVLGAVFTLGFALVPPLALLLCWWTTRGTRSDLFVWGAIGIGLVTLPGQFFFVSESLIAVQLFWPVVLWIAAGTAPRMLLLVGALVVFVALLHPTAAPLFLVGGVLLGLVAWRDRTDRVWRLVGATAFLAAGVARVIVVGAAGYDSDALSIFWLVEWFRRAVWGLPLLALLGLLVLAGAVLAARDDRAAPRALVLAGAALGGAGVALLVWAFENRWVFALDYRGWAPLASAPFMLFAVIDALRSPRTGGAAEAGLRAVPVLCALVFAAVVTVQSVQWRTELAAFDAAVAALPVACEENRDMPATAGSPLWHWGVRATSLLVQDRTPERIVMGDPTTCADVAAGPALPVSPHEATPRAGWFELEAISSG